MRYAILVLVSLAALASPAGAEPPAEATLAVVFGECVRDAELTLGEPGTDRLRTSTSGQSLRLPPGRYEVSRLMLRLRKETGPRDEFLLYGLTGVDQTSITVAPGENVLTLGGPFELRAEAVVWGRDHGQLDIMDAHLEGADGLRYRFDLSGPGSSSRLRKWLRAGERTLDLDDLEYG